MDVKSRTKLKAHRKDVITSEQDSNGTHISPLDRT
jgi:hypothetical protein